MKGIDVKNAGFGLVQGSVLLPVFFWVDKKAP